MKSIKGIRGRHIILYSLKITKWFPSLGSLIDFKEHTGMVRNFLKIFFAIPIITLNYSLWFLFSVH